MTVLQAHKFYFPRGGAETYLFALSEYLASRGSTVVPFAMQHPGNRQTPYSHYFPRFVPTEKVKMSPAGLRTVGRMFYSFESKRQMERLLRDVPIDVAHIHNLYTQLSPSILTPLRKRKIPTVMTVHDYHLVTPHYALPLAGQAVDVSRVGALRAAQTKFHKDSMAASFLQAASYRFTRRWRFYDRAISLFIAPSEFMAAKLRASGYDKDRIRVIHYGIDTRTIEPRFGHDGYFLFVGRLSEEKGVDTVLELAHRLPDLKFKIVGTGPDEALLHSVGDRLPNVEFMGYQQGQRLRDLYLGARAVLVPSRWEEPSGLVLLEAQACGKPVIASHAGGIPEAMEDRRSGFLVPPLDIHAWTEAVLRLAYDDRSREKMGRDARTLMEDRFSLRAHYEAVEHVYAEAIRLGGSA